MSKNSPEESQAVPFFARFLEGQNFEEISEEESEAVSGGTTITSSKYPSDKEDCGENAMTKKYPSDCADVAYTTKKHNYDKDIIFVTMKFPSDSEDSTDQNNTIS
jgi:hypothetical protein